MVDFAFKKTNELTQQEKEQICSLFERVFKIEKPMALFESEFDKNILGFSYHSLMYDDGNIVGSYTSIPVKYNYFGKEVIFALSVDTMIDEDYRGNALNLKKMAELVYSKIKEDGIPFVFGAPNANVYLIRKKILKWKDVAQLDYYILPIKIGAVKKKLSMLNPLSEIYAIAVNILTQSPNKVTPKVFPKKNIEKVNDNFFMDWRYSGSDFNVVKNGNKYFSYKVKNVDGLNLAYIMDVFPLEKEYFESVVKYVTEKELNNVDAVFYTGKLDFSPINLYELPEKFNPRPYRISGKILIEGEIDNKIFDVNNWNLNISNFDFY